MSMSAIENDLFRLVELFRESGIPHADLDDMRDLIRSGEPGVAFENLCTQIFEYDAALTAETAERLAVNGRLMNLNEEVWKRLGALVR